MNGPAALPFSLRRSRDVIGANEVTTTEETIHGLLRLEAGRLVLQWRLKREVSRVGPEIRTDEEVEPVREVVLPLAALAGAVVHQQGWGWFRRTQLTLTAADLRAFEEIAGAAGLQLDHPATLALSIPRTGELPAREFAAELNVRRAELPDAGYAEHRLADGLESLPNNQSDD